MTLNQLLYFQKIAAMGNMGKAAKALHISQPSLSVSISNLEKELNLSLFHRNGHNLELSAEGEQLLAHAEAILADLQAAQLHMQSLSANRDILIRIGCISPVLWEHLPRMVRAFLSRPENRKMKVEFITDNTVPLIAKLRDGYCDFLICSASDEDGLCQTELIAEPFVLLCPPDAYVPQSWEDLFACSVIGFQKQTAAYYEIYDMLKPYGIEPVYGHIAPDEASIASLVAHGFGYGICPHVSLLKNYNVQIAPLPLPKKGMVRRIYVTQLASRPPVGAAQRFLKYLMASAGPDKQEAPFTGALL